MRVQAFSAVISLVAEVIRNVARNARRIFVTETLRVFFISGEACVQFKSNDANALRLRRCRG